MAHYHRDTGKEYSDKESKRLRRSKIIGGAVGAGLEGAAQLYVHKKFGSSLLPIHPLQRASGLSIMGGVGSGIGAAVGHDRIQNDARAKRNRKMNEYTFEELVYLGEQVYRFGMNAETMDLVNKMSKAKTGNVLNKKDHKMLKKHSKKWHGK